MVQKLLQVRAHLILCFRAEEKVEMVKDSKGKMHIIPKVSPSGLDGWIPISEKNLPFELTMSFLLTADRPGIPQPIKLQEQHKEAIDISKVLNEAAGEKLAVWAAGGEPRPDPAPVALPIEDRVIEMEGAFEAIGVTTQEIVDEIGKDLSEVTESDFAKLKAFYKLRKTS